MDNIIILTLFICLLLWAIQFCKQNNNINIQLCKLINSYNLDKKNKEELSKNFLKVESELAKSVNKGVYKKNTASRLISRLAKKIKAIN